MTDVPTQGQIDHFITAVEGNDIMYLLNFLQDYPDAIDARDKYGFTALTTASRLGCNMVIRFLLEYGADINAPTATGLTPLMMSAVSAPLKTVELLLEHHADETLCDKNGHDVHDVAASWMRGDVKALFEKRRAKEEVRRQAQADAHIRKLSQQKPRNPFGKGPSAG